MNIHSMTLSASSTTSQRDPEHKRESILDAALALFSDRGFHGVAVPEVASRAKVAAGTIYRYFPSKEALVNAVYQREKQALGAALLQDFPVDAPPRAQLSHFIRRAFEYALYNPEGLKFLELHHHKDYLDDASRAIENTMLAPAYAFIAKAQAAMVLKPLPAELMVALVWGMFTGIVRAHAEGRVPLDEPSIAAAEECCWQAIRA
jgi:AcrR family transcriptional regulator